MSKIEVNQISSQCGSTLTVGQSGDTVTLAAGATQTGFGRTGTVDWQTGSIKTSTFTAANGEGYFANTSGGAFTMNLPTGVVGNIVSVVDYTNTFQTNALTIAPNGSEKIGGIAASQTLSTEGQSVTFVYVDAIEGWKNVQDSTSNVTGNDNIIATGGTITECGDYKIHTFTGPGTFTVCAVGTVSPTSDKVDYLVVAGGGGSGANPNGFDSGGGGGGGGFRESSGAASGCYSVSPLGACVSALTVTVQGYPITVGGGGTAGAATPGNGCQGSNSIFSTITSAGGGAGGAGGATPGTKPGGDGGSGAGAGAGSSCAVGGAGNTPPVSPPQGQNGGSQSVSPNWYGGGGGGATATGSAGSPSGGAGGNGATTSISASSTSYAGGGAGGQSPNRSPTGGPASGGTGGGGPANTAGTTNTGGGAGGGSGSVGKAGGSGIVIIRYKFQ